MSGAAPRDFRRLSQVVDSARPVGALLEVVCQLGHDFLHPPRVHRCETLANPTMKFRSASRRLSIVENLAVQHMHERVALGQAAVGKRMSTRPFHYMTPPRQLLIKSLHTARIDVRCGTDDARGEECACDTRQLQRTLLLFGQSL